MSTLDASRLSEVEQASPSKPPKISLQSPFAPSLPCLFCRGTHWNWECTVYPSASQRLAIVRKRRFCAKCNHPHKALKCKKPEAKCGACKGPHLRALCEVLYPDNPHLLANEAQTRSSPPKQLRNTTWGRANEENSGEHRSETGELEKHIANLVSNAVVERTQQLEEKIASLESVILEQNKAKALLTEREQRVEDGELDNDLRSQTLDAHQSQLCQLKTSLDEQAKSIDARERITTDWEIRLHQREKALDEYHDALDRQRRDFQATSTRHQGNVQEAGEEVARILEELLASQTTLSALQRLLVQEAATEVPNDVFMQVKQEPNDTVQESAAHGGSNTGSTPATGTQNTPNDGTSRRKRSSRTAAGALVSIRELPAKYARHNPASTCPQD